jgi:transcriptional regulator with XRE-family HTH domain
VTGSIAAPDAALSRESRSRVSTGPNRVVTSELITHAGGSEDIEPAAARLAEEIRCRRKAAGLSHAQLAVKTGYTRQYVSLAERPRKGLPSVDLVRALDRALAAGGALSALRELAERARQAHRGRDAATEVAVTPVRPAPKQSCRRAIGSDPVVDIQVDTGDGAIQAPPGRFFAGTTIPARAYPARDDGRILTAVPPGFADDTFVRHPRRGLVVGVTAEPHHKGLFALDTRQARRRLGGAPDDAPLLMPRAYALDNLTLGVLWAVSNLDEALLDDDAALARSSGHTHVYEQLPRSAAGREIAADLAPVSQMWLGSHFCASHILRHVDTIADVPRFWTREQRGEEASTWLLFAHKFAYLQRSAGNGDHIAPRRAFCIPPSAVSESHQAERILLLLAMALMESFGIIVDVCVEPEYTAVPGFVVDGHRKAIVANWVGTDGLWQVDLIDSPPLLREFADATGFAQAHSAVAAETPGSRLRAMADYLDVDWAWLLRRTAELGQYGSGGIAAPRSRLLSTDGVDRACRFLAGQESDSQ